MSLRTFFQNYPSGLAWCFAPVLVVFTTMSFADEKIAKKVPGEPKKLSRTEQERILEHFNATSADFGPNGKLTLIYDFESKDEDLAEDFFPHISRTKNRVRWSRGYEGTFRTVENGIIIADSGQWLHKAKWKNNVRIEMDYMSMATTRRGDLLAAVYVGKKNSGIGSNVGQQCVRVKGNRVAGKAYPKAQPLLPSEARLNFGMEYDKGVVKSLRGGVSTCDSSNVKNFTKRVADTGHVGMSWKGSVNGFVFRVVIEGELDPKWVKKMLAKKSK